MDDFVRQTIAHFFQLRYGVEASIAQFITIKLANILLLDNDVV